MSLRPLVRVRRYQALAADPLVRDAALFFLLFLVMAVGVIYFF
ncbi:MAG TPA: hypothetical protein VFO16_14120 [Pseudonocardiaceae bacterium]|nr:hypothetical protein [Pseudonocardiaceae bacterium]